MYSGKSGIKINIDSSDRKKQMIKEYFVIARYLARTPDGKDPIESVYKELESDLIRIVKFDRLSEIKEMFTILPGNEISEEDYDDD